MGFCFRRVEALDPFLINNSDAVVVNNPFLITYFRRVEAFDPFLINNSDAVVVINQKRIEGRHGLVAPPKQCARDLLWDGVPIALSGRAGSPPPS